MSTDNTTEHIVAARRVILEEAFRAKGVRPDVRDLAVGGVFESDDEVDEFIAAVRRWCGDEAA